MNTLDLQVTVRPPLRVSPGNEAPASVEVHEVADGGRWAVRLDRLADAGLWTPNFERLPGGVYSWDEACGLLRQELEGAA